MLAKQGRGARARFFRVGRVLFARAGSGQAAQPSLHALLPYASPAQAGAPSRRSTSSSVATAMRGPRLGPGLRRGRAEGDVVRAGCARAVLSRRTRPVRSGRIGSGCSTLPSLPSSLTLPRRRPGPSRAGRRHRALPPPCAAHDWAPASAGEGQRGMSCGRAARGRFFRFGRVLFDRAGLGHAARPPRCPPPLRFPGAGRGPVAQVDVIERCPHHARPTTGPRLSQDLCEHRPIPHPSPRRRPGPCGYPGAARRLGAVSPVLPPYMAAPACAGVTGRGNGATFGEGSPSPGKWGRKSASSKDGCTRPTGRAFLPPHSHGKALHQR